MPPSRFSSLPQLYTAATARHSFPWICLVCALAVQSGTYTNLNCTALLEQTVSRLRYARLALTNGYVTNCRRICTRHYACCLQVIMKIDVAQDVPHDTSGLPGKSTRLQLLRAQTLSQSATAATAPPLSYRTVGSTGPAALALVFLVVVFIY